MGTLLQRIQRIADNEGIKITALEKIIGASKGVLSRAISNGTDIQTKWIQLIVENYPNYSADWLLTGRGSMLKSDTANPNDIDRSYIDEIKRIFDLSVIPYTGLTVYQYGKYCGIPEYRIKQIYNLKYKPTEEEIGFLSHKLGLSRTWVSTGKEPQFETWKFNKDQFESEYKTFREAEDSKENRPVAIPTDNPKEGIPLIPVNAMAGALTSEQSVLEYECDRYVVPVFKGADFLIPVKGSSMYPKYSSGDIVACKRVPMTDLFFQWNKVYVLDTNQGALIKRIKRGSDSEHILIVSDNEAYEPFELPIRCIYNVAIVIGVIRLE